MPFSKILPDGYENDFAGKYQIQRPPEPKSTDPVIRAGQVRTVAGRELGAYLWEGGTHYTGTWEARPMAEYWSEQATIKKPAPVASGPGNVAELRAKLTDIESLLARSHGNIESAHSKVEGMLEFLR